MHRFGSLIIVTILFSLLWIQPLLAAPPQLDPAIAAQVTKLTQQEITKAEARLEKQADSRFDQVKYVFDETRNTFEWLVECAFVIIGLIIAVGIFIFFKNDKNLKDYQEQRETDFNKMVDDLEQKYKDNLRDATKKADQSLKKLHEVERMHGQVQTDIELL